MTLDNAKSRLAFVTTSHDFMRLFFCFLYNRGSYLEQLEVYAHVLFTRFNQLEFKFKVASLMSKTANALVVRSKVARILRTILEDNIHRCFAYGTVQMLLVQFFNFLCAKLIYYLQCGLLYWY